MIYTTTSVFTPKKQNKIKHEEQLRGKGLSTSRGADKDEFHEIIVHRS
jgi:hypothetical protein